MTFIRNMALIRALRLTCLHYQQAKEYESKNPKQFRHGEPQAGIHLHWRRILDLWRYCRANKPTHP